VSLSTAYGRRLYKLLVAALWVGVLIANFTDCAPNDVRTAEGLVPHFLMWLLIAVVSLFGMAKRVWVGAFAWPHMILIASVLVAIIDVSAFYLLAMCIFGLKIAQLRSHIFGWPLGIVAALQTPAWVSMCVAVIAGRLRGRRVEVTAEPGKAPADRA
jgi:hypothetical protein